MLTMGNDNFQLLGFVRLKKEIVVSSNSFKWNLKIGLKEYRIIKHLVKRVLIKMELNEI